MNDIHGAALIKKNIAVALILSVIMSLCMAFCMTGKNLGFNDMFVQTWLTDSCVGVVVSLPLAYFLPEYVRKRVFGWKRDPPV